QRLRQVHPAALAGAPAQTPGRHGLPGRQGHPPPTRQGRGDPAGPAAAVRGRPRRHLRVRPGPPRALPAPVGPVPVERGGRAERGTRPGGHPHDRARAPARRRALRRPAPARVGGDGPGAGEPGAAAGRADDLSGRLPPDRAAGPVRRSQPGRRAHPRRDPPRHQPRRPVRRTPGRDVARTHRGAGRTGRRAHPRTPRGGLRHRRCRHRGPRQRRAPGHHQTPRRRRRGTAPIAKGRTTMKARHMRTVLGSGLALLALTAAAACGSTVEADAEVETRTVTDATGTEVEVPVDPQRVVTLHYAATQPMLDLGLMPVGQGTFEEGIIPEDIEAEVEAVPVVTDGIEPRLEEIAGLDPDLILAPNVYEDDVLEQLRAVTAVYTFTLRGGDRAEWTQRTEEVADALNRTGMVAELEE